MMETVLSDFPLDEGIAVPVANAENKHLETELDTKQKEIQNNKDKAEEHKERIDAINEHLKNVLQELQHTQELLNARKRELETEDHFRQIAEREEGRLRNEMKRIQNDLNELDGRRNIAENNIFMKTKQLEELKSQMNWDQKALEAWLEESARRDEDALILEKYTRSDESKVKSLSLKTEKMTEESQKKRRGLEHELNRTATAQVELDKTAEEFRKIHTERQNLLEQWENTIEQMQKRDREMDQLAVRLAEFRLEVRSKEDLLKDRQNFLDNELNNNAEKEKKVSNSERQSAKLRLQYQDAENDRIRFQDELETLKYSVDRTGKDLNNAREKSNTLKKEVKTRQEKLAEVQNERDMFNIKLKETIESTMTAEERAFAMEQLLKEEEARIHHVGKELARLREIQFRKTEELHGRKVKEQNATAEIQGFRAASRNLSSKLHKLDQDSLKQQEILYMQDFQLQQLERKFMRMQGERSNEEKQLLEEKIKELSSQLEEQNSVHVLLTAQMKKLGDDLRREKRYLASGDEEKSDLISKIEELHLHNDSSEREFKKIIKNKEDAMVDDNILKLEIKRLREFLSGKADDVLSLEKRKLRLEASMNQRRQEIKDHKDMLRAQVKSANEERQTVSAELHDRISKIEKLRKRYEILMVSMAPPEGEEEKSQAYYVIKAAQEKEELQREGDELDAKIRKAEKEIRALENTLRLMNDRNENYRKSFNKVDHTSDEFEEREKLEEQLRAVMEKYKFKRRQIREVQEDVETMNSSLNALAKDEQSLAELLNERENKMAHLENELNEQKAKQERTKKHNSRMVRDIRSAKKSKGESHEERDIELREIRDFNTDIMKQIGVVVQSHEDMSAATQLYFNQAGLPAPPPPSRFGSRPSSAQSSRSSSRSSSLASTRSVSSVRSAESQRTVGSVNISLDLDEKPAASTSRSGVGSTVSKPKASSRQSSRPASQTGSRAGPKPGSRTGSQPGSPAGSKPGSRIGSQPGSPAGSKPGSRIGSQPGSPAGSQPGSRQGSARKSRS